MGAISSYFQQKPTNAGAYACWSGAALGRASFSCLLLILGCSNSASAATQDTDRVAALKRRFDQAPAAPTMKCEFQAFQPNLTFSLQYEAGYSLRFAKGEFTGPNHEIEVSLRMSSSSNPQSPIFLSNLLILPSTSAPGLYVEVSAHFGIDSGAYRVDSLATDDKGRVCRGQWNLEVRSSPSTIAAPRRHPTSRATVFLDATPLDRRSTTLQPPDIVALAGMVSSLTRSLAPASLRLVVLNLDSETELLRLQAFAQTDLKQLMDTLTSVQLGVIEYQRLEGRVGPATFLFRLIKRETEEPDRSQVVIFLGPSSHAHEPVTRERAATLSRTLPVFYYLEYLPPRRLTDWSSPDFVSTPSTSQQRTSSGTEYPRPLPLSAVPVDSFPDTIQRLMRRVHGHTVVFSTPTEFGQALEHIAKAR